MSAHGWTEVACHVADVIRDHPKVKPSAGRTQVDGPGAEIYTEWTAVYPSGREVVVMRETRYPGERQGDPDRLPCEHHVPLRWPDDDLTTARRRREMAAEFEALGEGEREAR